jgi:ABC-type lipoprotein release transport system permease subunit
LKFSLFIAIRYLFAKKSHNVINIISLISASGIAIGTAALIIILSVYNGFEDLIRSLYSAHECDLLITPSRGKTFDPGTVTFDQVRNSSDVVYFCEVIQENLFVKYGQEESVAIMKGVDSVFQSFTGLTHYITEGEFMLWHGEIPQAVIGRGVAITLGLKVHFLDPLILYLPSRTRQISMSNPVSSLNVEKVFPAGVFSLEKGFDNNYIFVPIEIARSLTEYDTEVTSVELYLKDGVDPAKVKEDLERLLGSDFVIKTRYQQNETLYKMMSSEKFSIYLILLFVIIIISTNLFGSLSMLIIEKKEDVKILRSMGAGDNLIKRLFLFEGWLISLLGILAGVILGLMICIIQIRYGIISMPGNFIVDAYPVVIKLRDVIFTVTGVAFIGYLASMFPSRFLKKVDIF